MWRFVSGAGDWASVRNRARRVGVLPDIELFDAAHVAAEPLAERLVAELGPGEPEQLMDLLTRLAHPDVEAWKVPIAAE